MEDRKKLVIHLKKHWSLQ